MAIVVVVDRGGADAEFLRPQQASFLRDVGECTVAVVVKKMALAVGSEKKIVVAIVVVVADGHAHSKYFHVQSCLVSYVGEGAVMIVVIELGRGVLLNVARPIHSVHTANIRPAVVGVVNEGHTRPHGFRQEFLTEGA